MPDRSSLQGPPFWRGDNEKSCCSVSAGYRGTADFASDMIGIVRWIPSIRVVASRIPDFKSGFEKNFGTSRGENHGDLLFSSSACLVIGLAALKCDS